METTSNHASADVNATGMNGLAAVHAATFDNHIDALKLLENLGANMMSFGDVEQTPAEIAYCNGYDIPLVGSTNLTTDLFGTKQNMAKRIMSKSWDVIFKREQNCSGFGRALNDAEDKLADMWAKNIGLKTLQELNRSSIHRYMSRSKSFSASSRTLVGGSNRKKTEAEIRMPSRTF